MNSIPEKLASQNQPLKRSDWFTLLTYHLKIRGWDDYQSFDFSFFRPPSEPAKILVIQLSSIGDVTYTLPALNGLKRRYPAAEVDLLTESACGVGARGHPALHKIWELPAGEWIKALETKNHQKFRREMRRVIHDLNEQNFDYLVNLHFSPLAAIMAMLVEADLKSGIIMQEDLQPAQQGNPFHTLRFLELLPENKKLPVSSAARHCLGLDAFYPEVNFYNRQDQEAEEKISTLYSQFHKTGRPHVLINTGSRMEKRRWPADHCRRVVERLLEDDIEVGLIGGPEDVERLDKISKDFPTGKLLIPWYKKTGSLVEDIHLSDRADLVITTDSGPQHLISIRNNPCLVLGGDMWVGPWNNKSYLLAGQTRRLDALPEEVIVRAALKMLAVKPPPGAEKVTVYSGRPGRESIWYRLLPVNEKSPPPAVFRTWLLGMIILSAWAGESRRYGWRSLEITPERAGEVYRKYWSENPPELEENIAAADILGRQLLSISEPDLEEKISDFVKYFKMNSKL